MMTTETTTHGSTPAPTPGPAPVSPRVSNGSSPVSFGRGSGVLLASGAAALVGVLALAGLAALTTGSTGAAGVVVGGGLALAVLLLGSLAVNAVAGVMPAFSLLFALLTYLLQLVVLAVVFAGLTGSGAMDRDLDAEWLGGAIIAVTMTWLVVQVVLSTRVRIPVYDLPSTVRRQADGR